MTSDSTQPCWLLPALFTLGQRQRSYEQIFGVTVSRGTFRSRFGIRIGDARPGQSVDEADIQTATDEFLGSSQRQARLFRFNHLSLFKRACC